MTKETVPTLVVFVWVKTTFDGPYTGSSTGKAPCSRCLQTIEDGEEYYGVDGVGIYCRKCILESKSDDEARLKDMVEKVSRRILELNIEEEKLLVKGLNSTDSLTAGRFRKDADIIREKIKELESILPKKPTPKEDAE